jgi:3-hydroxybutyryl-CoA dehydratase
MPHLDAVHASGLIQFDYDPLGRKVKPLVHGIFVSSLFSSIFSTLSPGCVYLNQSLQFSKPVYADDRVVARITIEKIRRWKKEGLVLQCETTVTVDNDGDSRTAISGVANVWLPSGQQ